MNRPILSPTSAPALPAGLRVLCLTWNFRPRCSVFFKYVVMPVQPDPSAGATSRTFLAKVSAITDRDVRLFVAWGPILHFYYSINGDSAPDIRVLLEMVKSSGKSRSPCRSRARAPVLTAGRRPPARRPPARPGWTSQINSITEYTKAAEFMVDATDAVKQFVKNTHDYQTHSRLYRCIARAESVAYTTSGEDRPGKRRKTDDAATGVFTIKIEDDKVVAVELDAHRASVYTAWWTVHNAGQSLIESGTTNKVRTRDELYNHWERTLSEEAIAGPATRYKKALVTLMRLVVAESA